MEQLRPSPLPIWLTFLQKVCITNMLGMATMLGCKSQTDVACLCSKQDFKNGVRDCIAESCPKQDAGAVTTFGNQICAGTFSGFLSLFELHLTNTFMAAGASGSGANTVTATGASGTATVVVSTGTDSCKQRHMYECTGLV